MFKKLVFIFCTTIFVYANSSLENKLQKIQSQMKKVVTEYYYYQDRVDFDVVDRDIKEKDMIPSIKDLHRAFNKQLDSKSKFISLYEVKETYGYIFNKSDISFKNYGEILYIDLNSIEKGDDIKLKDIIISNKKSKKIILDFRGIRYGNIDTGVKIADLFLDSGAIFAKRYKEAKEPRLKNKIIKAKKENTIILKDTEVVILVDKDTAHIAEVISHTLAYQSNIVTIGQDTFGDTTILAMISLNSFDYFIGVIGEMFADADIVVNNIGTIPNIKVIEDNKKLDKTLLTALSYLKRDKK